MKLEGRVTNPAAENGYRLVLYALILLASLLLGGCSVLAGAAPTPLPTVVLGNAAPSGSTATQPAGTTPPPVSSSQGSSGGVSASGIVVPAQSAQIASVSGGNIQSVKVAAGDLVQAGQVLVKLAGSERLAAAIEAANLELLSAQQALKTLNDNASQARTAAQLRLASAQKALDDAKKQRAWKQYRNGSQSSIDAAYADLILANNRLKTAEDTFKAFADSSQDDINRAGALSALSAARVAHDRALANLNYLLAMPSAIEVNLVEAKLQSAQAEVDNAQQEYDSLKNGPDPDALALAEERIKNAKAQIAAGQADLASLELKAPFSGTVTQVNIHTGEWATPGQVILALADLKTLRVETTDLSERNVPQVQTGQAVTVFVKALSQEVTGRVNEISALADQLGGDVIYKTTIELDSRPDGLRAGMSVEVTFN